MDYAQARYYDHDFIKSTDGSFAARADGSAGGDAGNQGSMGRTLLASTTYLVPLGSTDALLNSQAYLQCSHIKWDASVIVTITLETSCFPATKQGVMHGPADVTEYSTVKGEWIQENPAAYISVTSSDGTTGGATVASTTITVAGGTAGGAAIHVSGIGSRRTRLKFVVGGTGGVVRVGANGKLGS